MIIQSYGIYLTCGNEVLKVRRRDSYAYIDFMLARNFNPHKMTREEIHILKNYSFIKIFKDFFLDKNITSNQYNRTKNFYNKYINTILDTDYISDPDVENDMWGFPKGRINLGEHPYECAIREFKEETNINCELTINDDTPYFDTEVTINTDNKVLTFRTRYFKLSTNIKYDVDEYITLPGDIIRSKVISNEVSEMEWVSIQPMES